MRIYDVIIIGSGPAGLSAAIAAGRAGLEYVVVEKGVLVNTLFHFPVNMVFFTTPELLEIGGIPFVTPYEKPTRAEALRYYRRVTDAFDLQMAFDEEVTAIHREAPPEPPLSVHTRSGRGVSRVMRARTVVLATGCYDFPNMIRVPGEDLPHVRHYYNEPHGYYRKRVVIVGGKNSAAEAALDLYRNGAHVTLVYRRAQFSDSLKYWVKPDIENRIREGAIAALLSTEVVEILPASIVVSRRDCGIAGSQDGKVEELAADAVFLLTGYSGDRALMERAGIEVDPETGAPSHHPETFETNVPGLFVAGNIISGKLSGQVFIENGRFHGERVIAVIRERLGASR